MVALISGITPEQYLEQERKAEFKSEYVNGRIYAMSGVSKEHSIIAANVVSELHTRFKGRPYIVHGSDMRVQVEDTGKYAYPDVTAVCGPSRFADTHFDTLLNPTVIVEVLSPSTEAYDRGAKFAHYRRIPEMREYVLISQGRPIVEKYALQGEHWVLTEYANLEDVLALDSANCHIPLREIYDKVELASVSLFGDTSEENATADEAL